jgi:hypothetical protein
MTSVQHLNLSIFFSLASIILIGIFGNILNLIVFSAKTMRKNSAFRYLFYLSVIDLLVLITCATDSLSTYSNYIMIRLKSDLSCKIHTFLSYFLTDMSSSILMIVSIDRVFIIKNQSNKNKENNQNSNSLPSFRITIINKVSKIIKLLSISLLLCNLHYLIFMNRNSIENIKVYDYKRVLSLNSSIQTKIFQKLNISMDVFLKSNKNESNFYLYNEILSDIDFDSISQRNSLLRNHIDINQSNLTGSSYICYPNDYTNYYYFISRIWIWIDMIIFSLVPFIVMVICSTIIIHHIKDTNKNFLMSKNQYNTKILQKSKHRNRQLLIMLTITNSFFVICSLPLCIYIIINKFKTNINKRSSLLEIFQILSYLNNSFSFMFYLIFSEKYRQVIASVFFRLTQKSSKNKNEFHINKLYSLNNYSLGSKFKNYTSKNTFNQISKPINLTISKTIHENYSLDAIISLK